MVRKRKMRPGANRKVWVLIRRYEWEDQAQRAEYCDTFVFLSFGDAVRKAASLMRADIRKHGWRACGADLRIEEKAMLADFRTEFPRHLVQLTDGDNVVYELYKRSVR